MEPFACRQSDASVLPYLIAIVLSLSFLQAPLAGAKPKLWEPVTNCQITKEIEPMLDTIAAEFHRRTKRSLQITSAYRSPEKQASAMYTKLAVGGSLRIYKRQDLARPIAAAYHEGRKKKKSRAQIISDMSKVLEGQVENGDYISRHLKKTAFDIRIIRFTKRQQNILIDIIKKQKGTKVIFEGKPPHLHVELI